MLRVREFLLLWNFLYENWLYRKSRITLNRFLVIGINPVTRKVYVFSHFEPSGLRCELIVMPLGRVSRHDNIYEVSLTLLYALLPTSLYISLCS